MKIYWFSKRFLSIFVIISLLILIVPIEGDCQVRVRSEIGIPDILGYHTLKCDFHMHTIFSDGRVWPTIRPDEVWREGLDAFAITDHIEYLPHKEDISIKHGRSHELAKPRAEELKLIIIKGAEITRSEPPGHLNAIFIEDINPLDTKDYNDAIEAAVLQGGFIFWNHPGWKQPERKSVWYHTQNEFYEKEWLHGIEVVNGRNYYPNAHKWCLEKELTMVGNSDIHNPIHLDYDLHNGGHRPITLVFAKEKTKEAVKEALFAQRTAVYWGNVLIGEEKYLRPIFDKSVEIVNPDVTIKERGSVYIQVRNTSDVDFELEADELPEDISIPKNIILYAGKTVLLNIRGKSAKATGRKNIRIFYKVKNLWTAPEKSLVVDLNINPTFVPVEEK